MMHSMHSMNTCLVSQNDLMGWWLEKDSDSQSVFVVYVRILLTKIYTFFPCFELKKYHEDITNDFRWVNKNLFEG